MRANAKRLMLYSLAIVFLLSIFSGCTGSKDSEEREEPEKREELKVSSFLFPYEWFGNIDKIKFKEPSGIFFHLKSGTLFVVGDLGDFCEIQTDGTLVRQKHIRDADFEGITYVPATGLLYIVVEGDDKILEVDPEKLEVLREFTVPRSFQGKVLIKKGGQGLESIVFVPDAEHPEGGTFFITNQAFDFKDPEELSAVFQVELPLKSAAAADNNLEAKILRYFSLGVIDLSAIHYDSASNLLYIVSDATNTLFEVTLAGKIVKFYAFPENDQEGITLDRENYMYIAQDTGGIIKIKWIR